MSNQTNIKVPNELKEKIDLVYCKHRSASVEPRWNTVADAIDSLVDENGYDLDPEVESDDQTGRGIRR